MAIYRLTIEVLQGKRESEDDTVAHRRAAVDKLQELQARVAGVDGIVLYGPEDHAPWGYPRREDTFQIDFDSELADEGPSDAACAEHIAKFISDRG